MRKVLKKLKIFFIFLFAAFALPFQSPAYAADAFESLYDGTQKPDFSRGAVSIFDVENWNLNYTMGGESFDAYEKYFSENAVPLLTTVDSEDMYYAVIDENGDYAYRIMSNISSMSSTRKGVYLQSCITLDYIDLTSSAQEFAKFWASEAIFKERIRKKQAYIQEHLNDTEYGGVSYDSYNGRTNLKVSVYLVNEERRAELEKEGFECISCSYSLEQKYQAIEELWNRKAELGIFDIKTGNSEEILIYGSEDAETFYKKAGNALSVPYQYFKGAWSVFGSSGVKIKEDEAYLSDETKQSIAECAELDLEKPEDFISYMQKIDKCWTDLADEEYWENLLTAIQKLKQAYPTYSCRNLYYHVAGDYYSADEYLNFESELLGFIDTLPDYEADKNAAVEDIYGDPERLELKRLLYQYKKLHMEMSYKELYEQFIKHVEEDVLRSKEEKLYWYLWRKYSGTMEPYDPDQTIPSAAIIWIYDFLPVSNCFIQLEDIYDLIDIYDKNPELTNPEAREILQIYVRKYVPFSPKEDTYFSVDVTGEDGGIDYIYTTCPPSSSSCLADGGMLLHSYWTNEEIFLNQPKEEVMEFIERANKTAAQVKEKIRFVRNQLADDEYSGIYADDKGNVYVKLADESKGLLLDEAGILWRNTDIANSQLYEITQSLWEKREVLNITSAIIDSENEKIIIRGCDEKEVFYKKLEEAELWKEYSYIYEYYDSGVTYDTLEDYLAENMKGYSFEEEQMIAVLKDCMSGLEAKYPKYSYDNLFSLVFQNMGYEDFLKFDKEVEQFADVLVYYANEKDPFDEQSYGDPEKLLLKETLQKYKNIYPNKSCQELYDTYIKETAESKILSQREKRSKYLWEIVKARQIIAKEFEAKQQKKGELSESKIAYTAAGFAFLIAGCMAVIIIKRNAEKRQV